MKRPALPHLQHHNGEAPSPRVYLYSLTRRSTPYRDMSSCVDFPPSPQLRYNLGVAPSLYSESTRSLVSSRSSSPTVFTDTCVRDAMGGGKSIPFTVDDEIPTAVDSDGLVDHVCRGAAHVVEVDELTEDAIKSLKMIVHWHNGESVPSTFRKKARAIGTDYVNAIESSAKVARYGIAFAGEVIKLCELPTKELNIDVNSSIHGLQETVKLAHEDAVSSYEQFRKIRQEIIQIINEISVQQSEIKDRLDNRKRHSKGQDPTVALKLLHKASVDMLNLMGGVAKFANWWHKSGTIIATSERNLRFIVDLNRSQFNKIRKEWEGVRNRYEGYDRMIDALVDFCSVHKIRLSISKFSQLMAMLKGKPTKLTRLSVVLA
ncbi:hypothetical protein PILCRDRAFT_828351 [Piloderma croceum F 1598]|uniref:Uncharacterized protein n=1 Tax=Piloderma croceum (strain F 1598) TaxID=765440 RepID=A0A0C3F335_PILCF|nr:hypothetical protein PILCRDRAFT_828351 [Piloderma croceum F 1598]